MGENKSGSNMSMIIVELYDALKEAGASEERSRKASEAMAAFENKFAKVDLELAVVKWMVGFNLAATMAVLYLAIRHAP